MASFNYYPFASAATVDGLGPDSSAIGGGTGIVDIPTESVSWPEGFNDPNTTIDSVTQHVTFIKGTDSPDYMVFDYNLLKSGVILGGQSTLLLTTTQTRTLDQGFVVGSEADTGADWAAITHLRINTTSYQANMGNSGDYPLADRLFFTINYTVNLDPNLRAINGNVNALFGSASGSANQIFNTKTISGNVDGILGTATGTLNLILNAINRFNGDVNIPSLSLSADLITRATQSFPTLAPLTLSGNATNLGLPGDIQGNGVLILSAATMAGFIQGVAANPAFNLAADYSKFTFKLDGVTIPLVGFTIRTKNLDDATRISRSVLVSMVSNESIRAYATEHKSGYCELVSNRSVGGVTTETVIASGWVSTINLAESASIGFGSAYLKPSAKTYTAEKAVTWGTNSARLPLDFAIEPLDFVEFFGRKRRVYSVTHYAYSSQSIFSEVFF